MKAPFFNAIALHLVPVLRKRYKKPLMNYVDANNGGLCYAYAA
jgi:hypothetical protein